MWGVKMYFKNEKIKLSNGEVVELNISNIPKILSLSPEEMSEVQSHVNKLLSKQSKLIEAGVKKTSVY